MKRYGIKKDQTNFADPGVVERLFTFLGKSYTLGGVGGGGTRLKNP